MCLCLSCTSAGLEVGVLVSRAPARAYSSSVPCGASRQPSPLLALRSRSAPQAPQVPDLCYQPEGRCVASRRVDGLEPGSSSPSCAEGVSTCKARMGKVLCRAPV